MFQMFQTSERERSSQLGRQTYDQKVASSTRSRVAIKWLLLG